MQVGLLRQKLDSLEKCNLAMTQNYEGQLQTLKAQVRRLVHLISHILIYVLTYKSCVDFIKMDCFKYKQKFLYFNWRLYVGPCLSLLQRH